MKDAWGHMIAGALGPDCFFKVLEFKTGTVHLQQTSCCDSSLSCSNMEVVSARAATIHVTWSISPSRACEQNLKREGFRGLTNPYCQVSVGRQGPFTTDVVFDSNNPCWEDKRQTFEFRVSLACCIYYAVHLGRPLPPRAAVAADMHRALII